MNKNYSIQTSSLRLHFSSCLFLMIDSVYVLFVLNNTYRSNFIKKNNQTHRAWSLNCVCMWEMKACRKTDNFCYNFSLIFLHHLHNCHLLSDEWNKLNLFNYWRLMTLSTTSHNEFRVHFFINYLSHNKEMYLTIENYQF